MRRGAVKGVVAVSVGTGAMATVAATAQTALSEPKRSPRAQPTGTVALPREFALERATTLRWDHAAPAPKPATPAPKRASRASARLPLDPKGLARVLLAQRGWSGQWSCLNALWTRESNWRVTADNPSSSAYGIPQALPGSKMSAAGPDWRTNAGTQITWGLGYIKGRYGSPCAAWAYSQSHGYY